MKKQFIVSLLIILTLTIHAQKVQVFTGDLTTYISELSGFMQNVSGQRGAQVGIIVKAWEKDSIFSRQEQKQIIDLSQLLVNQNAKPDPHFLNFLSCMLAFKEYRIDTLSYNNWIKGLREILANDKTTTAQINTILEFTDNLLRENLIYRSSSTMWKVSNKNYKILNKNELIVDFANVDLICFAQRDSIPLFATMGTVYPARSIWKGKGGLVTWERGGYSRDSVFATLQEYEIDLTKSAYTAENVTFTNKFYFDEPLKGILNDKAKFIKDIEDVTFPKFDSYTREFIIPNLYQDIDYAGGLSMQGSKLVGTGTREKVAKLKLFRKDTLVMVASSLYFGFKSDRISSQRTAVTIMLKNDSIFHPNLFLTYRVNNKELTLLKTDNYSSQAPYSNSYHKVDMNFDQLTWRMDEYFMKFSPTRGKTIGNAYFESVNYFNYDKYMAMIKLDQAHPLVSLSNFARVYGSDEFPVEEFANYLKMPVNQAEQLAMHMANDGFIYYDMNTGIIKIKPRLYDNLDASINKIDYDVIGFNSRIESPNENAIFDLKTYDLTIVGISQIYLSDSQNVAIYPSNNRIILKGNRNFQFDGVVEAGLLTFFGKNYFFNYDSFKINMQNVDSLHIKYLTGKLDNYGLPINQDVKNMLNSITGEIIIDHPDNKSGRISYPDYPIFKSKESSYVYYEKANIQNGAYKSNNFFFEVYPFELDSLDNFNYKNLLFDGKFVSAGIFPSFEKELSLQPDHSLGFRHFTPTEGFPVYEGRGKYYKEIWLSNKGLKGDGKLEYLTSTVLSKDFNFYPDSMNTLSTNFNIAQKSTETQYPLTYSVNNYIHWLPYADILYADRTDIDFTMFNDSTRLTGNLKLEPAGLSGTGRMDLRNSEINSNLFTYKANDIYSDTADFFLKSLYTDGFTVLTKNINAHIDYMQKQGWFKSNTGFSLVSFPDNKYISYLDYFVWDMTKKELAMRSEKVPVETDFTIEESEPIGPKYISVHHAQDSLSFVSPVAYYDYKNNSIRATGVKFIKVADARIYPYEGKIIVIRDAIMQPLENARIVADTLTKYHAIHTATLNISGKNYYQGIGNYDYIDENGKTQVIHFSEIKVDTTLHTVASGNIFATTDFYLSPVYKYQGKVFLQSQDSLLTFKGAILVEHNCDRLPPDWLYFRSEIDPNNIFIPLSVQPVNIDLNKIQAGLYMHYDSVHIYPSFFTPRKNYSDRALITSKEFLYYDKNQQLFKIGSKEKINDFILPQDYLSLQPEDCKLYGEGRIDLGENLGQVKLNTYGAVKHDIFKNETTLDVVLMMDFYISESMIDIMANEIDSIPDLEPVNLNRPISRKSMDASLGAETAQKIRDELSLFGTINRLPPELKHTIIFNELKLKWNDETNSYRSEGKIGIGSISDVQINKLVNGFLELQIKRSGDIMDFYLEIDRGTYYYFGYTRGVMQTLSSNRRYVESILDMKAKERKSKAHKKETSYIYLISTDQKKNTFYSRYRDAMEGIISEDE